MVILCYFQEVILLKKLEIVDPIIESIKKENLKLYGYKAIPGDHRR